MVGVKGWDWVKSVGLGLSTGIRIKGLGLMDGIGIKGWDWG